MSADSATVTDGIWPAEVACAIAALPELLRDERERRGLSIRKAVAESGVAYHVYKRTEDGDLPQGRNAITLFCWLSESADHEDAS